MQLLAEACEFENLRSSWCKVRNKRGGPGIDGISIPIFCINADARLRKLQKELLERIYAPQPLLQLWIRQRNGKLRHLHIPTVRDRIAQHSVLRAVSPVIDPLLEETCFAYRRGSSVREALSKINEYYKQGFLWGVKTDIKSYFDSVDHDILWEQLKGSINDRNLIDLIIRWVKAEIVNEGNLFINEKGLPQGAPISSLLANIYLLHFDRKIHNTCRKLIRYGDDVHVLCQNKSEAVGAVEVVESILRNLRLSLNPEKTSIINLEKPFKHLGATVFGPMVLIPPLQKRSDQGDNNSYGTKISELSFEYEPYTRPEYIYPIIRTLYIQEQGSVLRKNGERFVICKGSDKLLEVPVIKIDQIAVFGNCTITTPAMIYALKLKIPILLFSQKGSFYGKIEPDGHSDIDLHRYQFLRSIDPDFCMSTAKSIVKAKLHNSRMFLLRRGYKTYCKELIETADILSHLIEKVRGAKRLNELRGYEGKAAACYFRAFKHLLKYQMGFEKRLHHPSPDPVNSLLSFGYTLLFNNIYFFVKAYGLNPYVGYFHAVRKGHPALVSDLTEEFRAPIVDSLIAYLINSQVIRDSDFCCSVGRQNIKLCLLTNSARKQFIEQFEFRMNSRITHKLINRKISWRDCISLQVRQMVEYIKGRRNVYKPMEIKS